MIPVARVVSGGQTGVDRAALDVAVELGLPYGGWCPRGGWAEDLPEPPGLLARYPALRETASADPAVRTRCNVRDSDATLVVTDVTPSGGTALTVRLAEELDRPHLVTADPTEALAWLAGLRSSTGRGVDPAPGLVLNVAGPRESTRPGTYQRCRGLLRRVLSP